MGAAVSSRQTWDRDARSDAAEIQVMVRCQGNRVLGAGLQDGLLHLTQIFNPPAKYTRLYTRLLDNFALESEPLGPYKCPNHKEGHRVDGARLRDAVYRLSPSGRPKKRGKAPSVDIKTVELA
jgi:hypothetical protein